MGTLFNRLLRSTTGYRHFNSELEEFYANSPGFRVASVNNHALDLERLGDCRITRFIRDPRDLVVSGYFYHRRGAEDWCNIINPSESDLKVVNGCLPDGIQRGESFSAYLNSLSQVDGLLAEIDFRANHFCSMRNWPVDDSRIRVFRYEDILGREVETFSEILRFYDVAWHERQIGRLLAHYFSARRHSTRSRHIRNPQPGQWQSVFTEKVNRYFEDRYGDILVRYNYR